MPTHEVVFTEGMRLGFFLGASLVVLIQLLAWCWVTRAQIWKVLKFWILACLNRKDE